MSIVMNAALAAIVSLRTAHADSPPTPSHSERRALRCEWRRLARRLADLNIELDADTVGTLLDVYTRMKKLREPIDPMCDALIRQMAMQTIDARLEP